MIAVAELLNKNRLPGNYFASDAYVQGDFELGLLENRHGNRLVSLPNTLLQALYSSLEDEVGSAAGLVMFQCGHWWGKYFYRRFAEEVSTYYQKPLAEMEMVEFLQCLKQCWKTYGWGNLNLEFKHYSQGFIIATIENSAFAEVRKKNENPPEKPACYAEAGLLSTFFSQLTGQDLHCVQTTCEAMGASENIFILGLEERLKVAETCVEEQHDHDTVMMRLGLDQTNVAEPVVSASPEHDYSERQSASFTAVETPIAEATALEQDSLASTEAPEMRVDIENIDALERAEDLSPDMTVPPVEGVNIDISNAVTEEPPAGIEETADMTAESFAAVEMTAAGTAEAPAIEATEAMNMLTDLPDLEALDSAEEVSADMPDGVTEDGSVESEETADIPETAFATTDLPDLETLDSTEESSADMTVPPVEDVNVDISDVVTEESLAGSEETADMTAESFAAAELPAEETMETPQIESTEAMDMLTDLADLEALDSTEEVSADLPEVVTEDKSVESEETADMTAESFAAAELPAEETMETPQIESTEAMNMLTDLTDLETLESAEEFSADMTVPPVEDINIDISEAVTEEPPAGSEETADMPVESVAAVEMTAEGTAEAPAIETTEAIDMLTDLPDLGAVDSTEAVSTDMPEVVTEDESVASEETMKAPPIESTEAMNMLTDLTDLETLESAEEFSAAMTAPPVEDINIDISEAVAEEPPAAIEETADIPAESVAAVEMTAEETAEVPEIESTAGMDRLTNIPDLEALDSTEESTEDMTMPPVENSNIDMPEAITEEPPSGFEETALSPVPEMIDEPKGDDSSLSSDSLEALDHLVGLADLDGLNELEAFGE